MKKIKFLSIILVFVIGITVFSVAETNEPSINDDLKSAEQYTVLFHGGKAYATVNEKQVWLDGEIIKVGDCVYIAPEQLLLSMGFSMGWKDDIKAVVAVKKGVTSYIITNSPVLWKGPEKYTSKNSTILFKGIFYIPLDMFEYYTDAKVSYDGELPVVNYKIRDLLSDTVVGNTYRLGGTATPYKGVYVSGNFAMERVSITQSAAVSYAGIVNNIASKLPQDVNVYNIVVPTAAEFYGPSNVYTNQTAGIKTIYENLSERVTPVNVVKTLYNHANESIYFRTDHHWTQRGAYYAYNEFAKVSGNTLPPLSSFQVKTGSYVGSFANFAKGTYGETVCRNNPDTIERFIIPSFTAGASYSDMYLKKYNRSIQAVYANSNAYTAFLGGDNPLSVITTNVGNGKKIVIIKESFGNAFATWALNNYSEIYVIDVRKFNQNGSRFNLKEFYDFVHYDDLVIINYPVSVTSSAIRQYLNAFI